MFGFLHRGRPDIRHGHTPLPDAHEMRLIQLQERVAQAGHLLRAYLAEQSRLEWEDRDPACDVALEVLVVLGPAPAADVPVIPGRAL